MYVKSFGICISLSISCYTYSIFWLLASSASPSSFAGRAALPAAAPAACIYWVIIAIYWGLAIAIIIMGLAIAIIIMGFIIAIIGLLLAAAASPPSAAEGTGGGTAVGAGWPMIVLRGTMLGYCGVAMGL